MKSVDFSDTAYPDLLKQINPNPKKLYYKGSWDEEIFENCLAVVGSRRMTSYGRQITMKLVSEIAAAGVTIVSGFMYGVDACAHQAALCGGGRTIAVMPCGINRIHPDYQKNLYQQIIKEKGLIISEQAADVQPNSWSYPRRNRIVAGLSKATLVVEAALGSGSLITANLTKKYGRKLFALPGPLTSLVSEGTIKLIKEGAEMVTCGEDILAYFKLKSQNKSKEEGKFSFLDKLEKKILKKLQEEPSGIDDLSRFCAISSSRLSAKLSLLQLRGVVFQEAGKYWAER